MRRAQFLLEPFLVGDIDQRCNGAIGSRDDPDRQVDLLPPPLAVDQPELVCPRRRSRVYPSLAVEVLHAPPVFRCDEGRKGHLTLDILTGVAAQPFALAVCKRDGHISFNYDGGRTGVLKDAPVEVAGTLRLHLGTPSPGRLQDEVAEFGKTGGRIAAFLEVEVCAAVERLDDCLLTPAAGEDDERYRESSAPNLLEERDAVHLRHLVVGDDGIVWGLGEHIEGLQRRCRCLDLYISIPLQVCAGQFEKRRVVIDCKYLGHKLNNDSVAETISLFELAWRETRAHQTSSLPVRYPRITTALNVFRQNTPTSRWPCTGSGNGISAGCSHRARGSVHPPCGSVSNGVSPRGGLEDPPPLSPLSPQ